MFMGGYLWMGVYGCIGVGVLTVEIARKHRDPSHYSGRRGGTCGSQRRKSSERWSTSRWPFPGRISAWVGKWGKVRKGWVGRVRGGKRARD